MTLTAGTYIGKVTAIEDVQIGYSNNDTEQIGIPFVITQGEQVGVRRVWYGNFSERGIEFTLKTLRACGWKGDDLTDLTGIADNEVALVFGEDTYEGRTTIKLKWVNPIGGKVKLAKQMDPAQLRAFAASLKGEVIAHRQASGSQAPTGTRPPSAGTRPAGHQHPPPETFVPDEVPF